jgi:hypothetical protein
MAKRRCAACGWLPDRAAAQRSPATLSLETSVAYCRLLFIAYYPRFIRFGANAFLSAALQFFDAAARRCVVDNTTAILAGGSGADAPIAPEMEAFGELFGFELIAHAINHSDRKGRIERSFSYVRITSSPGAPSPTGRIPMPRPAPRAGMPPTSSPSVSWV